MKIRDYLADLPYEILQGSDEIEVGGIVTDNRKAEAGCLFVCIAGANFDGHSAAADVAAKGAAALIVEKPVEVPEGITVIRVESTRCALAHVSAAYFGYPARSMKVIGVTGTKGKTTTTYLIKSLRRCYLPVCKPRLV